MKVKEAMNDCLVSVPPTEPVIEVARKMVIFETDVISVCDSEKFWGLITGKEIIAGIVAQDGKSLTDRASSFMKDYPTISPDDDFDYAAKIMARNHVSVVPVAQQGKLVGLFTMNDIARQSLALAASVLFHSIEEKHSGRRTDS